MSDANPLTREERDEILGFADDPKKNVLDDDVRRYEATLLATEARVDALRAMLFEIRHLLRDERPGIGMSVWDAAGDALRADDEASA